VHGLIAIKIAFRFQLALLFICAGCLRPSVSNLALARSVCDQESPSGSLPNFVVLSQQSLKSFEHDSTPLRRLALASLYHIRSLTDSNQPDHNILTWQEGDKFPSVWLRPFGKPATLVRLDPHMRGNDVERISRIIISPESSKIAVITRRRGALTNSLSFIQGLSGAASIVELDAYDAAWLGNKDLLVSTKERELPSKIFHIGKDGKPSLLTQALSKSEALLLHQARDGVSVFIEHSLPHAVSIDLVTSDNPLQPIRLIDSDLPGSSCVRFKQEPLCLSFKNDTGGQLIRFQSINPIKKEKLDTGSNRAPYVDLDAGEHFVVGIISHGASSEARIFEDGSSVPRVVRAPGPTTTFSVRKVRNFENKPMLRSESFLSPPLVRPLSEIEASPKTLTEPRLPICDGCSESALTARSNDGTLIPISLVSPQNPVGVIIQVYGAYGIPSYATYSPATIALLTSGIAVAIAHIRGGGELGPTWHKQTLGDRKIISIQDIIAVTTHLQNVLRISPHQTILSGRSAGALLVSNAALTTPGLCGSLILDAPMLDLSAIISDPSLPLHEREVHEWGALHNASHSFLSQLPRVFPLLNMLVHVPLRDELIPPETTLRWAHQAFCSLNGRSDVLVYLSKNAGHAGPQSRADEDAWSSLQQVFAQRVIQRPAIP